MRLIIAGSREISNQHSVMRTIDRIVADYDLEISEVVSGCARGVDRIGEKWAEIHLIPIKRFPAKWEQFGKGAGMVRNKEMARYARETKGGLIAVWDGVSPGTKNMIDVAKGFKLKVVVAKIVVEIEEFSL